MDFLPLSNCLLTYSAPQQVTAVMCLMYILKFKYIFENMWCHFICVYIYMFYLFIFNGRIKALQYYIGFCHTFTRICHNNTYNPSFLNLPPTSHPILPLQVITANSHCLFYIWQCMCFHELSPFIPPSPSLTPMSISLSSYFCISIAALQQVYQYHPS